MIGQMVFTAEDAACREVDPDLFFPAPGGGSPRESRAARAVCARCPLLEPCRDYALRFLEWGIWGGLTERQRKELRRDWGITAQSPNPTAVLSTKPHAVRKRQLRAERAA